MEKETKITFALKYCVTIRKIVLFLFFSISLLICSCKANPIRLNIENSDEKNGIIYIKGENTPFTGIMFRENINNGISKLHEEFNVVDGILNGKTPPAKGVVTFRLLS